ncbi:MAG TPA: PucR family transcriptional regulator ligand-binding domain-containing protein [Bacillota bacterium]|nr:PucR family transcriptional regulator ligand-binding domain-containing protein [Bacillota bacterium]
MRQALRLGGLAASKLVAGHQGIDNEISSVDIIEVPDVWDWIIPKELGITCCYAIRQDIEAQKRLVLAMSDKEAAGLAVKPGRFLGTSMPEVMIDAANQTGLPLIEVPISIPYSQITVPILSAIMNDHASRLQYESYINSSFIQCVIQDQGLDGIVRMLNQIIGRPVCVADLSGRLLAFSRDTFVPTHVKDVVEGNRSLFVRSKELGVVVEDMLCFPVVGKAGSLGYVIVDCSSECSELSVFDEIALKSALSVVTLELTKHRMLQETEERLRKEFLAKHDLKRIVAGYQTQHNGGARNFDFQNEYVVIVAKGDLDLEDRKACSTVTWSDRGLDTLLARMECTGEVFWEPIFVDNTKNELVIVCWGVDCGGRDRLSDDLTSYIKRLRKEICSYVGRNVFLGVSGVHKGIDCFEEALAEAKKAVDIGDMGLLSDGVLLHQDTSVYEFVANVERGRRIEFATETLGPLLAEDDAEELLKTLIVFVRCGGQVTQAAEELFIHRNTLNYRLDKINALLGVNVKEADEQFRIRLALISGYMSGVFK